MVIRYLMLLVAFIVLTVGCVDRRQQQGTQDAPGVQEAISGAVPGEDPIAVSLITDLPDERHLAMLAVTTFKLEGYHEQLAALAPDDPVASVALTAIHGDPAPMVEYFTMHEAGRSDALLGAVLGLSCAADVPAAAWEDILALAGEDELDRLLWGLAQLDVEPGGPLASSGLLMEQLAEHHAEAITTGNITRRAAADALLGTAVLRTTDWGGYIVSRTIDWQVYLDYAAQATWNGVQWRALLRRAEPGTWRTILSLPDLTDNTRVLLAQALIMGGPEMVLPGIPGQWLALGAELELRANGFMTGRSETIDMPELGRVLVPAEGSSNDDTVEPELQLHKGNLATVLVLFRYALLRGDSQGVQAVLELVPELPEEGRNAVLATAMRTHPAAVTDEQLNALIELNDRSLGYFLLLGWHDREPVQRSDIARLVRISPGKENILIAEAYRQWLDSKQ